LEQASEHPLAAAVVKAARERRLALEAVQNFESIPGQGVRGIVAGHAVAVGNNSLIHAPGQTGSMLVSIDGQFAGAINVSDRVKESTHEALRMLRREGIQIVMATGDRRSSAEQIASTLGIDQIRAEVLPQQKAEVVREFQARRHVVAMAGDGINDAPALTAANVGIAMGTGTDIAIESAAITLVHGDLRAIVRAIHLSRKTMRNIRQNLFFAFVYNIVGVPIAAGVLYPVFGILLSPMIASAAMTFSSVSVISNALRLRTVQL
ncbi:MAG: HAD-IC family P-type ATPase, partial [Acidobacteriaceae bacterium]|nr:HAD-IC family P-type ATPase [Acidobacteriaceae bacterium]